ncbi:hypothetical protein [Streptomyces sp. MI02-7b]|uniref:hypothetical protein n=1 Tax=Streptomyces sp. MI02-7b TaxID=462941 RepID=UPI0029BAC26B|nr:hypothetical protein [Streptomyces sp. MI02-7b]MDX3075856.1 hypothetical protein [Streptomyces sp. MI02-7b]
MVAALRLEVTGAVQGFELPEDYTRQRRVLRSLLGGAVDGAVYHRRALLHVHGHGALSVGRDLNAAAWALASTWRGAELPCGLYGTAVVTGPNLGNGGCDDLDDDLAGQVQSVCEATSRVLTEWVDCPPEGEAQARAQLLGATVIGRAAAGRGSIPRPIRQ